MDDPKAPYDWSTNQTPRTIICVGCDTEVLYEHSLVSTAPATVDVERRYWCSRTCFNTRKNCVRQDAI